MKSIVLALVAWFSLIAAAGFVQTKDEAAVEQAVEHLRVLMISPDKAKLEAIAADQLSYGHSSGKIEGKDAFVEALVSGTSDFVSISLVDQTVSVVDNTALVRHKLMGETLDGGKPGQVKLSVLQVWIKQRGGWKLLARQAVKIP